jgi:cellulose synthase/poly-beta-1,6-N-acetylglucosamine synthase-like glycosyltransferase
MTLALWLLLIAPAAGFAFAYAVKPLLLRVASRRQRNNGERRGAAEWPAVSIVVTAYNAERVIGRTLEQLLAADYPADRRQLIVVSDASTDGTDDIVHGLAQRGVELHRITTRRGKTVAENSVAPRLRGDIVVNVDASGDVAPSAIKTLVRHFADPGIGVVSGRAVSVPGEAVGAHASHGDATYYGYEMWVRSLEMRFGAVIGATGALYAVRRELFDAALPAHATRDFASPLLAWERGYRSVIDDDAVCYVRQLPSLRREYRRKLRTMVRGLDTLYAFRHLMDPIRHGWFALMLASHKLCRWLVFLMVPLALAGALFLAVEWWPARLVVVAALVACALGIAAVRWPHGRPMPAVMALLGYTVIGGVAGVVAWHRFLRGEHVVVWEPTRRVS